MSDKKVELRVDDVAEQLQVNPETVRVWLRDGRFPGAYRFGKRAGWRIPQEDVDALRRPKQ